MSGKTEEGTGCVWVLSGAPNPPTPTALSWVPRPDKIIAADGGYALAQTLGLTPDLVVGDFDSIDSAALDQIVASGVQVRRYQHEVKWETDTELAVLAALDWNPSRIVILGAIGGRLDHTLGNILLLTHPGLELVDITIVEGNQQLFLARPGVWNAVPGDVGDVVSLLPVGGDVEGVTNEGMEYPLRAETLQQGQGRGISNVIASSQARFRFERGTLLVCVMHC